MFIICKMCFDSYQYLTSFDFSTQIIAVLFILIWKVCKDLPLHSFVPLMTSQAHLQVQNWKLPKVEDFPPGETGAFVSWEYETDVIEDFSGFNLKIDDMDETS